MKIIKEKNIIKLICNGNMIEEYSFDNSITFDKYMKYLLSLNLKKIVIEDLIYVKSELDIELINSIKKITVCYNEKVDVLNKIKSEYNSK